MIVLDKTKDNEIAICLSEKADAYSKIVIKLEKTGSSNVVTLGYSKLKLISLPGYAIEFSVAGYVDLGSNFLVTDYNVPHSYSAWVYLFSANQNAWVFNNSGAVGGDSLVVWGGYIGMFYNGGNAVVTGNTKVPLNQWNLIQFSYDGAGSVTFYLNGVADGVKSVAGGWSPPVGSNCRIGTWYDGSYQFLTKIDELRVYNRTLTAQESTDHYNSGIGQCGQPESGLIAGWHFDEGSGSTVNDYSGNDHHGTFVGGVSFVDGIVEYIGYTSGDILITDRCWQFQATSSDLANIDQGDLIYSVFGTTGSFTYATGSSSIDTSNMTLLEKGKAFIEVTEPIVSTYSPGAIEYVTYKPEN